MLVIGPVLSSLTHSRYRRSKEEMTISWKRNEQVITVGARELHFSLPVYKVCELGADVGFCVVLIAEQDSSESQATALIYSCSGDLIKEIDIREKGWRVRFGSCSVQDGLLCLSGDNDYRYCLDMLKWQVVRKGYYR